MSRFLAISTMTGALLAFGGPQAAKASEGIASEFAVTASHHMPGAMTSLDESELASIVGAQGVVLEIRLSNNVDSESLAPLACTMSLGTPNPCRMGLEFAARSGIWLMFKEFFGQLHFRDLRMDVAFLPGANTAYYNANRFRDVLGNNLLPGANPTNQPAIQFRYPGVDAQATYDDFFVYLNVGRAWLEYDTGPTPGYDRDTSADSVLSLRMADSISTIPGNHNPAKTRFWGTAYVFGF